MANMKWKKQIHPMFGSYPHTMKEMLGECPVGKWQWRSGKFSIISPSFVTHGLYELFDGEDVLRFATLKEAQSEAENQLTINPI